MARDLRLTDPRGYLHGEVQPYACHATCTDILLEILYCTDEAREPASLARGSTLASEGWHMRARAVF